MKKWKKNFLRVPTDILTKSEQIDSNDVVVSCARQISLSDIEGGMYAHIGIVAVEGEIEFGASIIPDRTTGRYSKYNVEGRVIKLKHLPKIVLNYSADVPNFGDWSKGSHGITWSRKAYPREIKMPRFLSLQIELLNRIEDIFTFKFSLDTILSKSDAAFMDDLLYHCNVLQENVGLCDVYAADSSNSEYINTLYVDWELLPPGRGNIDTNIRLITGTVRNPSEALDREIRERMEFFETLDLKTYIRAKNKFNRYFGAILNNDLVILENIRYGNAIYIFKANWEDFSKLSRTELINMNSRDIIRVVHNSNWKNNVKLAVIQAS